MFYFLAHRGDLAGDIIEELIYKTCECAGERLRRLFSWLQQCGHCRGSGKCGGRRCWVLYSRFNGFAGVQIGLQWVNFVHFSGLEK